LGSEVVRVTVFRKQSSQRTQQIAQRRTSVPEQRFDSQTGQGSVPNTTAEVTGRSQTAGLMRDMAS